MKRKVLAQFLAFGLALTSLPVSVSAAEISEDVVIEAESAADEMVDAEALKEEEAPSEEDGTQDESSEDEDRYYDYEGKGADSVFNLDD